MNNNMEGLGNLLAPLYSADEVTVGSLLASGIDYNSQHNHQHTGFQIVPCMWPETFANEEVIEETETQVSPPAAQPPINGVFYLERPPQLRKTQFTTQLAKELELDYAQDEESEEETDYEESEDSTPKEKASSRKRRRGKKWNEEDEEMRQQQLREQAEAEGLPWPAHKKRTRRRVPTTTQRKAANVRERRRMSNLNGAFDFLRRRVPTFAYEKHLSRIETLRLAIGYIRFMQDLLEEENEDMRELYVNAAAEISAKWANVNI